MIKRIGLITIIVMIVLSSCSMNMNEYASDVEATELGRLVNEIIDDDAMYMLDDDVILKYSDKSIPYLVDYCIFRAKESKNINEFGIFRFEDGKTHEFEKLIIEYVGNLQKSYRAMNYFPSEEEKIDFARIKVYGNYVVYSFLNEEDTDKFYSTLEEILKK